MVQGTLSQVGVFKARESEGAPGRVASLLDALREQIRSAQLPFSQPGMSPHPDLGVVADGIFEEVCTMPALRQWMASLPLRGLPSIRSIRVDALEPEAGADAEATVYAEIARDWEGLCEKDRRVATHLYIHSLREATELFQAGR